MKNIPPVLIALTAILLTLLSQAALADNLVQNPGFEAGFSGWSENDFGLYGPPQVESGQAAAYTGCVGDGCMNLSSGAYLEQTLNTVPGTVYDLSFWVAENNGPAAEMAVEWGGEQIADVMNPASNTCLDRWSICHFVEYSYPGLLATGNATVLEINGRQDPGYMIFDDFSVTPATQADEPASLWPLAVGLLGTLGVARSRLSRRIRP